MSEVKTKNEYRISVKTFREQEGLEDREDFQNFLEEVVSDSISPALCTEGCQVEPDGYCEHGNPSILLALGLI